jgi:hypothetical protein
VQHATIIVFVLEWQKSGHNGLNKEREGKVKPKPGDCSAFRLPSSPTKRGKVAFYNTQVPSSAVANDSNYIRYQGS